MVLVYTDVLVDAVENDPAWADWSQGQLEAPALRGPVCINPVIYLMDGTDTRNPG